MRIGSLGFAQAPALSICCTTVGIGIVAIVVFFFL
jgi:hypothetical protein